MSKRVVIECDVCGKECEKYYNLAAKRPKSNWRDVRTADICEECYRKLMADMPALRLIMDGPWVKVV